MTLSTMLGVVTEVIPEALSAIWQFAMANTLTQLACGTGILMLGFVIFRKIRRTVR